MATLKDVTEFKKEHQDEAYELVDDLLNAVEDVDTDPYKVIDSICDNSDLDPMFLLGVHMAMEQILERNLEDFDTEDDMDDEDMGNEELGNNGEPIPPEVNEDGDQER